MAVVQRVPEDRAEANHEPDQHVEQAVDRALQRGARVTERARGAGKPCCETVGADVRHPVPGCALDHERAGENGVSGSVMRRFGLARQDRLVQLKVCRGYERAVGDELVPGLKHDHVVDHDLLDRHGAG